MKRKKNGANVFSAALLSFMAAFGGVGCLLTGMRLEGSGFWLAVGCAVLALGFSLAFQKPRLSWIPFCVVALILGFWWEEFRYSLEGMIYAISDLYDQGYGWGVVQWSEWHLLDPDSTLALLVTALPVVIAVSATTVYGQLGLLGSAVAIVPMVLCVLLKDTVPSPVFLAILFFAVVMILLTENVRSRQAEQADRLVKLLCLPVAAVLALLFLLSPPATYNGQEGAQKLEDFILQLLEQEEAPELFDKPEYQNGDQEKVVQLDKVGQRQESDKLIMTVKSQERVLLYLRGCAYDIYDGKSWSSTPGWNAWSLYYNSNSSEMKSLTIRTQEPHSVLYFTYTPFDTERRVVGGRMRNDEELTHYTVRYRDPIAYDESLNEKSDDIGGAQLAEYLQLPDSTRAEAEKILRTRVGIPSETNNAGQVWRNAQLIAQWVSNRGKYDLNAPQMPATQDDFALWFLEKSKTGYCTHFATATTVLLRAAGIPAQYVTGYIVDLRGGEEVKVTQKQAHAWVEVFINGVGWVVLEPTPGYGQTQSDDPSTVTPTYTPQQTDSTEPEQTILTTETTEHTHGTEPGGTQSGTEHQATQPGQTQIPTEGTGGAGIGGGGGKQDDSLLTGLLWLLLAVVMLLAVILQWRLRVSARHSRMTRGEPNTCALRRWHTLERMAKLLKTQPSEESLQVAQKAAFSQHTVSREELKVMGAELTALTARLKQKNLFCRLYHTLILALY